MPRFCGAGVSSSSNSLPAPPAAPTTSAVTSVRRLLLKALPKVALSRATGGLARVPVPRALRSFAYRAFARRYRVDLSEMQGTPADYPTFAAFFQRPLRAGVRPLAAAALVWPADGRVVAAGPLRSARIAQVKGVDYALADLVADGQLAEALAGGSQATVYLAPGDYHRVHAPFDGEVLSVRRVPGGLFPVNDKAVRCINGLFVRNERLVLESRLDDGRRAAVVLVAALNVSDTTTASGIPGQVSRGQEIGRFGLGSTVVTVLAAGTPSIPEHAPGRAVRLGASAL